MERMVAHEGAVPWRRSAPQERQEGPDDAEDPARGAHLPSARTIDAQTNSKPASPRMSLRLT